MAESAVCASTLTSLSRQIHPTCLQGIGYATEVGEDAGRGFNVNVPWSEKGVGDADYMAGETGAVRACFGLNDSIL